MGIDLAIGSEMVVSWGDVKVNVSETAGGIRVSHDCVEGKPAVLIVLKNINMGKKWSRVILRCFSHDDDLRRWVAHKAPQYGKDVTFYEITHEGMKPLEVKAE